MDDQLTNVSGIHAQYLIRLAIAIGIGFLIGLERTFTKTIEEGEENFAGLRTLTMIAVSGFLSALLASHTTPWFLAVGFAGMVVFVAVSYFRTSSLPGNIGGTSEIATILTFLLGALVFYNMVLLAIVITVATLLLLAYKPTLHGFVTKLSREELLAIIKFTIISALVIPFLPNSNFGPYDVWNLKDIWKMVILVSGVSLVGYVIAKFVGNKGTMVAGMIGGLVSSTAVTLTFSRRSKQSKTDAPTFYFAMAILGACTIMFPRILVEVAVVNPRLAQQLWIPIAFITLTGFAAAFYIYRKNIKKGSTDSVPLSNPLNFGTAVKFAILFAGVMLLVKYADENFGNRGTYIAGAISGITDVDAITLSMAKMNTTPSVAINTILIAALSNTLVKFLIVLIVGSGPLIRVALGGFVAMFAVGAGFLVYNMIS